MLGTVDLVSPSLAHLSSFRTAVLRSWSPSSEPGALERFTRQLSCDPAAFLESLDESKGTVRLSRCLTAAPTCVSCSASQ